MELSQINENNNKNVADGLAWGYYFGYLKMVLPILAERIGQTDYKYLIPIHKLFILIPKTCYIYDSNLGFDLDYSGYHKNLIQ